MDVFDVNGTVGLFATVYGIYGNVGPTLPCSYTSGPPVMYNVLSVFTDRYGTGGAVVPCVQGLLGY